MTNARKLLARKLYTYSDLDIPGVAKQVEKPEAWVREVVDE